jgi:predicted transcriptional regulator
MDAVRIVARMLRQEFDAVTAGLSLPHVDDDDPNTPRLVHLRGVADEMVRSKEFGRAYDAAFAYCRSTNDHALIERLESVRDARGRLIVGLHAGLDFSIAPAYDAVGRAINQLERFAAAPARAAADALSGNEYSVLLALRDARPQRVQLMDLATMAGISRRAVGTLIQGLARRGLADYDKKKRVGATITASGDKLLTGNQHAH